MKNVPWILALIFATFSIVLLSMRLWSGDEIAVVPNPHANCVGAQVGQAQVPITISVPKPYPVFVDTGRAYWFSLPVDTGAILAEHFSRNLYRDTLKDDTSALVVVVDTVSWNALQGRGLIFQNRRSTHQQIPSPLPPNRLKIYAGGTVGRRADEFAVGPAMMLVTPKDHAYSLAYDVMNQCVYLNAYWKIGFRRKVP